MKSTRCTELLLSLSLAGQLSATAADPVHLDPITNKTQEQRDDRMAWFDEARFGMFIHWGVYAVPAGEWQGKPVSGYAEWIMKNGEIPIADYKALAPRFTAAKYDPAAWARLAKTAGMRYVVITSKHHDGFALYDSAVTDWDVMQSGAKRDLLAPLADAVRAEGLKFGLYYSQAQDWTHPGGGIWGDEWDPAHEGDFGDYVETIALPQTKEIVERYQPDILWWDTPTGGMTGERAKPFVSLMAQHPAIVSNDRLGGGFKGDTKTPEQHIPPRGYPGERFEVCMTMNDSWGFLKNDQNWKPLRQIIRNLSDISSKGGNFLLNVGPTAEGEIPSPSIELLEGVGRWMKVNSEAIHGTTSSPFPRRLPWGRVTQKTSAAGTTLFLHVWEWPSDGHLLLPTLQATPRSARVLADDRKVHAIPSADGLVVNLTGTAPDPDVSIVVLNFESPVTITQAAFAGPGADGAINLHPMDADLHGSYAGNISLYGDGASAILTRWLDPEWRIEYQLKTPAARTWRVFAEVAAPTATKLTLRSGKTDVPVDLAPTGPGQTWQTVELGSIALPAGQTSLELVPVKGHWESIELKSVRLTPLP